MPGIAQPSVWNAFSGSSSLVVVTAPFSVMPQAETMSAPSVFVARSTSTRGIGAPAARKMRKVATSQPP